MLYKDFQRKLDVCYEKWISCDSRKDEKLRQNITTFLKCPFQDQQLTASTGIEPVLRQALMRETLKMVSRYIHEL